MEPFPWGFFFFFFVFSDITREEDAAESVPDVPSRLGCDSFLESSFSCEGSWGAPWRPSLDPTSAVPLSTTGRGGFSPSRPSHMPGIGSSAESGVRNDLLVRPVLLHPTGGKAALAFGPPPPPTTAGEDDKEEACEGGGSGRTREDEVVGMGGTRSEGITGKDVAPEGSGSLNISSSGRWLSRRSTPIDGRSARGSGNALALDSVVVVVGSGGGAVAPHTSSFSRSMGLARSNGGAGRKKDRRPTLVVTGAEGVTAVVGGRSPSRSLPSRLKSGPVTWAEGGVNGRSAGEPS